jgi:hypothetical protein
MKNISEMKEESENQSSAWRIEEEMKAKKAKISAK